MRTTPGKRTNSEVMKKSVIEVMILTLLTVTASLASAQQVPLELQVPFNPSPTFDPGARPVVGDLVGSASASLDSSRLQQRMINSAGAYLPGLGFKYPSFNQHDILRYVDICRNAQKGFSWFRELGQNSSVMGRKAGCAQWQATQLLELILGTQDKPFCTSLYETVHNQHGSRIGTSEPIFWLLSQAIVGQNQLNNNGEITTGCPNPAALIISCQTSSS